MSLRKSPQLTPQLLTAPRKNAPQNLATRLDCVWKGCFGEGRRVGEVRFDRQKLKN
jgi:hypothetical protein